MNDKSDVLLDYEAIAQDSQRFQNDDNQLLTPDDSTQRGNGTDKSFKFQSTPENEGNSKLLGDKPMKSGLLGYLQRNMREKYEKNDEALEKELARINFDPCQ